MKASTLVILAVIGVIIYRAWQNMKNAAIAGTQRKGILGSNTDNDWVTNNPAPWQTPCTSTQPPIQSIGGIRPQPVGIAIAPVPEPLIPPSPVFLGPPILSGGGGGENGTGRVSAMALMQ
jgi:hypothetical protein